MAENLVVSGIGLDTKDLKRGVQRSEREMQKLEKRSARLSKRFSSVGAAGKRLGGSLLALGGAAGVAAAAFAGFRFLKDTIKFFEEQESAENALNAALLATGKSAPEVARGFDLLAASASELQRQTTVADEALLKATATLAQLAPALDAEELARAQRALIGIAKTFLRGDVENAALLLGKSIGSTTNALTRYGIQIDTAASQSEKLNQVVDQSASFFAVAKAEVDTLRGSKEQLSNAFGDFKEAAGGVIVDVLELTDNNRSLTDSIFDQVDAIDTNRVALVRWGQLGLEVVKLLGSGAVNMLDIFVTTAAATGTVLRSTLFRMGSDLARVLNLIPGFDLPAAEFFEEAVLASEAFQRQTQAIADDVQDVFNRVTALGRALSDAAAQTPLQRRERPAVTPPTVQYCPVN